MMMKKFMYDVVDEETKEVIKKDEVQKLIVEGMTIESAIESIKFFCAWAGEEVVNVRVVE